MRDQCRDCIYFRISDDNKEWDGYCKQTHTPVDADSTACDSFVCSFDY